MTANKLLKIATLTIVVAFSDKALCMEHKGNDVSNDEQEEMKPGETNQQEELVFHNHRVIFSLVNIPILESIYSDDSTKTPASGYSISWDYHFIPYFAMGVEFRYLVRKSWYLGIPCSEQRDTLVHRLEPAVRILGSLPLLNGSLILEALLGIGPSMELNDGNEDNHIDEKLISLQTRFALGASFLFADPWIIYLSVGIIWDWKGDTELTKPGKEFEDFYGWGFVDTSLGVGYEF